MTSSDHGRDSAESEQFDQIADLVARAILALECDGQAAADAVLAADPRRADAARERIQSLRDAGMLCASGDDLPEQIGEFRVLERLGRGGMGEVYLAEQQSPVSRRVALKVIRRGMDTREVLARFAIERQALALLDHPNIAKIHDAGETSDGRPYLVMEYVAGVPVTNYCDERELSTEARIELVAEICDTVQHAHQRGILHRDLKPTNVLVLDRDGKPWPKVIDFGVAKSTQHRFAGATMHTEVGRLLGTPEYMSPEQAANRVDLDTRTDVYSLGVILYELLTGSLPIESARLRAVGQGEMERILQREDPPTPSTRISTRGDASLEIASRRRTDPGSLRRQLRGDLDWITMKALERDRNRRYPMAAAFAQDLRRHLAFEPVIAGPPGAWYRVTRFARRHRGATVAAATILLSLVVGLGASVTFWREARAAQLNEATARADVEDALDVALRAANEMLVEVGGDRLRRIPGFAVERRRLLESGLAFCRSVMEKTPVRSRRLVTAGLVESRIASFQLALGLDAEAAATLDQIVVPPSERAVDPEDLEQLQLSIAKVRAALCAAAGDSPGATTARREAVRLARALLARAPADPARQDAEGIALGALARELAATDVSGEEVGRVYAEAHAATRRAIERPGEPSPALPALLRNWASEAHREIDRGEAGRAAPILVELEQQLRRLLERKPDDLELLDELAPALALRARALQVSGEVGAAERDARGAIEIFERMCASFPGDDGLVSALASVRLTLVDCLVKTFRYTDAIAETGRIVAAREAIFAHAPQSKSSALDLAFALGKQALVILDRYRLKPDVDLEPVRIGTQRAVEIADRMMADATLDLPTRTNLAQAYFARSQYGESTGDFELMTVNLDRSLAIITAAVEAEPEKVSLRFTQEYQYRAAGRARLATGDVAGARSRFELAVRCEDDLRARGVVYGDSDGRLGELCSLLASACAASGALREAEEAARRALELSTARQMIVRDVAATYLVIAAKAADPDTRHGLLDLALSTATRAREILLESSGGDRGPSFRIASHAILLQIAAVHRARAEPSQAELLLREAIEDARVVFRQRASAADRDRLATTFDALIESVESRGDAEQAAALRTERTADLGGG